MTRNSLTMCVNGTIINHIVNFCYGDTVNQSVIRGTYHVSVVSVSVRQDHKAYRHLLRRCDREKGRKNKDYESKDL